MMVELGPELWYQEYLYNIDIWPLGSEVRQQIEIVHNGLAYFGGIYIYAPVARLKVLPRFWASIARGWRSNI